MEKFRRTLGHDQNLYPVLPGRLALHKDQRERESSVISVGSSDGSPVHAKSRSHPVVISSDEENILAPAKAHATNASRDHHEPVVARATHLAGAVVNHVMAKVSGGHPIPAPSNKDVPRPPPHMVQQPKPPHASSLDPKWETFNLPNELNLFDPRKTAAEAEKDLRNLMEGNFESEGDIVIDEEAKKVKGFREEITLLDHQVLGRKWMAERESGKKLGGILADDMGLGKTVQALTRIVDHRPRKTDAQEGWAAPTLIVCPVALVSQWAAEINKYCVGIQVIEHHGPKRDYDPERLKRSHVVITSYSTVASEHSSYVPANDEGKSGKGKQKKNTQSSSSDFDSDSDASDSGGPSKARMMRAIGSKKPTRGRGLGSKDALFRVKWWRIVLDEAHNIKNRNTKAALACCALMGKYRWCLTGTPMQNSVEELYSLIKFLQIRPLNDWQVFNDNINKPVKSGRSVRAMKRLQVVLKSIMLRRRKDHIINGKPILDLPARNVEIVHCPFSASERAFYDAIQAKVEDSLEKIMGSEKKNYTSILLLLLRLRQACNHPMLISKDYQDDSEALEPTAAKTNDDDEDDADDLAGVFGRLNVKTMTCQVCLAEITPRNRADGDAKHCIDCAPLASKGRARQSGSGLPPESAKVRELLRILMEIEDREDGEKTIVFSQFTSMLDLIQPFLDHHGIKYARYDGKMRKDQREASLNKIKTSRSTRVILISFKAGSTGLNLTACNNVILFDLWWNPALEDQAFDRAHRLGQERDVNIFKLTIEDTVEERILALQDKKRELAKAALSGDKLKNMRLGMDDLLALFGPGRDDEEED